MGIFKNKDILSLLNAFENLVQMMKRVLMGRGIIPLASFCSPGWHLLVAWL